MKIITTKEPVMGIVEYKDKITYKTEDGQNSPMKFQQLTMKKNLTKENFCQKI